MLIAQEVIITLVFIFISCKEIEKERKVSSIIKFEVKNASNKNVNLSLFFRNEILFKNVQINTFDSLIVDEGVIPPAPDGPTYNLTNSIDSAIILFEDGKKLTQTFYERGNNDTINNVLSSLFYVVYNNKYRFTIKQSDYLRAQ